MQITSSAFEQSQPVPSRYTCDDTNCNPPLTFTRVPEEARSLVLIVEDPDAPSGVFTHWLVYDIPPSIQYIMENEVPSQSMEGKNSFGKSGYNGPCPPSGKHRYIFQLSALDTTLELPPGRTKEEVRAKMKGHVIATAELVGTYTRG